VRPLDPLLNSRAFAAWEDERVVPDAVLGAEPRHPAFKVMIAKARLAIENGADAWASGPGVTTNTLPGRDDVLLLPPGSFYPVHYKEKNRLGTRNDLPWVFLEHKWHHSWSAKQVPTPVSAEEQELPKAAGPSDVVICIPWRDSGDERRRAAYKWCLKWWYWHGFTVVSGQGQSRAEMCNDAAEQAALLGASVFIFADADTWAPAEQVRQAADAARSVPVLIHAFQTYSKLDSSATIQGLRTAQSKISPARYSRMGKRTNEHVSGLSAVSAELWGRIGGFDERFDKWGFEDQAFHLACEVLGDGPPARIPGIAIHWAHRADPTRNVQPSQEHLELMQKYCHAAGRVPAYGRTGRLARAGLIALATNDADPAGMREVLAEEGGPLWARSAVS